MFTLDSTIDTIQNSKKQFVNAFVLNENALVASFCEIYIGSFRKN